MADLRDVLHRIDKPSLYIGGEYNTVSLESQRWICDQIPDVRHVVFETHEGGGHFMYLENPDKFNALVAGFIDATQS